jgi:hypothetical protein
MTIKLVIATLLVALLGSQRTRALVIPVKKSSFSHIKCNKFCYLDRSRHLKSAFALDSAYISLDRTVLPRPSSASKNGVFLSLLAVFVLWLFRLPIIDRNGGSDVDSGKVGLQILVDRLSNFPRMLIDIFSSLKKSILNIFRRARINYDSDGDILNLDDWTVGTLGFKESLNGGQYIKCRVDLHNAAAKLGLNLGQEVCRNTHFF